MTAMNRYLVLTKRKTTFRQSAVEPHYAFLERLRSEGKLELGGGFTDKTGGAYILKAADLAEAEAIAFQDPIHVTDSSLVTVYEWNAK